MDEDIQKVIIIKNFKGFIMSRTLALTVLMFFTLQISVSCAKEITTDDVFSLAIQIENEVEILKRHFNVKKKMNAALIKTLMKPRHVWQKAYEILIKINILREYNGMSFITFNILAPSIELRPVLVYEQVRRILLEIDLFKVRLGITGKRKDPVKVYGKTPVDVYNKLNYVSYQFDTITEEYLDYSHNFAQAMRIFEDVTAVIDHMQIDDIGIYPPPKKTDVMPEDTFKIVFTLISEIQHLLKGAGIEIVDFSEFMVEEITPVEVFSITELALAELQVLKGYIGLKNTLTPNAKNYHGKKSVDVQQILEWSFQKLKLMETLL